MKRIPRFGSWITTIWNPCLKCSRKSMVHFWFFVVIKSFGLMRCFVASERIMGWYHSGPKLRASDLEINQVLRRYVPNPVLVIIDAQHKSVGLPVDSYMAVEEIHDVCGGNHVWIWTLFMERRMAQPPVSHSIICLPISRQKRQRRLEWSTCCVTLWTIHRDR